MDKRKVMMILSIVVIVVCAGFSVYMLTNKDNDDSDGDKISNIDNKEILKDMKYDDMDIVGQLLDTGDGNSKYLARIVNNSGKDKKIDKLYVVFEFDNEKFFAQKEKLMEYLKNGSAENCARKIENFVKNLQN